MATGQAYRGIHIVLVGDSTVAEGTGWGSGFRQLATPEVRVTNSARKGQSSKSFRDQGLWATALAARGNYYLIQFGYDDQPASGHEFETDPATTYPANLARYVDEVRAIGAVPILVTPLSRRAFARSNPTRLASTLRPWVEAIKQVAADKAVPLVDLDATSRAFYEQLGPVETLRFDVRAAAGTWDTINLDATGSVAIAKLVVRDLRRLVPALVPFLREDEQTRLSDPPDLPAPLPLLSGPGTGTGMRLPRGRVYTRELRIDRYRRRMDHNGLEPDLGRLPRLVVSPAILVAWDYVPSEPPEGAVGCDFARDAPTRVEIQDRTEVPIAALQPLTVTFDRARIRELLEPYESDIARVRWLAVLDPSRLRPNTFLFWISTRPCDPGFASSRTFAGISAQDVQSWLAPTAVPQQN